MRRAACLVAVAVAMLGISLMTTTPATAGGSGSAGVWQTQQLNPPGDDEVFAVGASSLDDEWVVGRENQNQGWTSILWADHWDGTTWTIYDIPQVPDARGSWLEAVAVLSPTDAWAAGSSQDNNNNVTVLVTAKGAIDHLTIGVSSPNRPDLTQSQLYTLIITGHLPSSGSGGGVGATAQNEAASMIAGVIAGSLQKTLAKHLPVDVLTIDAGGGQGLTGTQLEAGRYVTDRLYVGYVGRIGADPTRYQNRNAVHVEYRLTERWQIAGEYGDVGTGSADLMWKKSY